LDTETKIIAILKVLSEFSEPIGSITIAREIGRYGISLSERAIRYHLKLTDERHYTQPQGQDGRTITPEGLEELKLALAAEQVGFILDKLDLLTFQTTFDPQKREGLLPINTSLFPREQFNKALAAMEDAFKAGICVSELIAIAHEGEKLGAVIVPKDKIGLATVCSLTINGVLLKSGVPIRPILGGVLELRDNKPRRFVTVIHYAGTSIDPSEQYIRARMTSVKEVARTGSGNILASFREIPAPARAIVSRKVALLKDSGVNGVYLLGNTSEHICQIRVGLNRVGIILQGGLNPVAAAVEAGVEVDNIAESGLIDFQQLVSFWSLRN
jgi:HTH-type transcriptional regulator, global nitrogen regulator NrpRI